ncbi:MAG: hypothetical protein RIS94_1522 [Pseudomonadota bacterium]|jgi:PAS domain S-box-containing protein
MHNAAVLREILDAQLEMVCRFRADGTILYTNRAYAQMLGQSPEAIAGRNLWDFILGEDRAGVQAQLASLDRDHPEITIENRLDTPGGPRWTLWRNHGLEFDADGRLLVAQSTGIDITERRLLEDRTRLLIEELNHRVKNTLMVVQAMAFQTFRGSGLPSGPVATFNERLAALAAAHTALSRANWGGTSIGDLVREGTAICGPVGESGLRLDGPDVIVPAEPTVQLVMVLHELATNAMKYGALSVPGGTVDIRWHLDETCSRLRLDWQERHGPPVGPPTRQGFGSRLIRDAVERQMHGQAKVAYDPGGLHCTMDFPLGQPA